MDATQLSAIRERVDAATPGPWAQPAANVFRVIAPDAEHHNPSQGMTPPYPWRIICQEDEDDANGVNAEFIAHARTDVPALLDEVERLQAREVHFARVLRVPDGGEYLNDWDSRLTGLLDEVERLHTALARLVGSAHPYGRTDVVTVSVPFLEEARAALRTDPEEK